MEGTRCAFGNNGRILALLSPDGRLKIWDCTAGSLKHEYTSPSHLSTSCTCLRWSRTSRTTVSLKTHNCVACSKESSSLRSLLLNKRRNNMQCSILLVQEVIAEVIFKNYGSNVVQTCVDFEDPPTFLS